MFIDLSDRNLSIVYVSSTPDISNNVRHIVIDSCLGLAYLCNEIQLYFPNIFYLTFSFSNN